MTPTSLWIVVAAVLAAVLVAAVSALALTWQRRVGGRVFDVEVAM